MAALNFARVLDRLIKARKTKVKELCEATGITRQAISDYRRGISTPKSGILIKLADYFGVSCDYLLTGKDYNGEFNSPIDKIYTELWNNALEAQIKQLKQQITELEDVFYRDNPITELEAN